MPVALVIGNSDGIGFALTNLLLEEDGWQVVGISRSGTLVRSARYEHHLLDVNHPEYKEHLTRIIEGLPELDVCVYCVGIGEFLDLRTFANEQRVFETNLLGAIRTAEVLIPILLRRGRGHFIGLSSQSDRMVAPSAPSYAASKAALSSYLEGLAWACRPHGVYVTNVRLGFVDTKMAKAPVRPFIISAVAAARRIRRCIHQRPIRDTYPKKMAVLLALVSLGAGVRRWFANRVNALRARPRVFVASPEVPRIAAQHEPGPPALLSPPDEATPDVPSTVQRGSDAGSSAASA